MVWDKIGNRMYSPYEFSQHHIIKSTGRITACALYKELFVDVTDNFLLLQSTDLPDKNRKEIFESFILNLNEIKGLVEYRNGCFWVNWEDKTSSPLYPECREAEIIGNIYENPELLN